MVETKQYPAYLFCTCLIVKIIEIYKVYQNIAACAVNVYCFTIGIITFI